MEEKIGLAKEELKRVDHLFYVSLKYTKTGDVIMSIVERLINSFNFSIDALFLYMEKKKKVMEVPDNAVAKIAKIKKLFKNDEQFIEDIDLYQLLRKINRSDYSTVREFRKHVTMSTVVDEKGVDVNIDVIEEYFKRTKEFVDKSYKLIHGIKDE
jgi:hypothetical protein